MNEEYLTKKKCSNPACDKMVLVRSVRGPGSSGYCSRICEGMRRYAKRYTGTQAGYRDLPYELMEKKRTM